MVYRAKQESPEKIQLTVWSRHDGAFLATAPP